MQIHPWIFYIPPVLLQSRVTVFLPWSIRVPIFLGNLQRVVQILIPVLLSKVLRFLIFGVKMLGESWGL
jgi:hypothetical protein